MMMKSAYDILYKKSIVTPQLFWDSIAKKALVWKTKYEEICGESWSDKNWFGGGTLNITESCLDRHIQNGQGGKIAYKEIDENDTERTITYTILLERVCQLANALSKRGIKK